MQKLESAIESFRAGDRESFGIIYDSFIKRIYDFAFYRTFDRDASEEIASDTFYKALKSFESFGGSSESELASWLFRIAYNTIVDRSRTLKQHEELDDHAESLGEQTDHASAIDAKERLGKVLAYLETLPVRDKDIVLMAVWDDLKYAEIAEISGESLSNVKKIISRTLAKIAANIAMFLFFFLF